MHRDLLLCYHKVPPYEFNIMAESEKVKFCLTERRRLETAIREKKLDIVSMMAFNEELQEQAARDPALIRGMGGRKWYLEPVSE